MAQNNVIKEVSIKKGNLNLLEKQLGAEAQNIDVSYDSEGKIIRDITEPGVIIDETKSLTDTLIDIQNNTSDKTVSWEEMDILGSKNFLPIESKRFTDNGISFVIDSGTILMRGQSTEEVIYEIALPKPINYACKFTISCQNLVQGVSVFVLDDNDTVIGDGYFGEGGKSGNDEIIINSSQRIYKIRIKVRTNIYINYLMLEPMLRLSCIKDKNFTSYAMTNKGLTNEVLDNKILFKNTIGWVSKNLANIDDIQRETTNRFSLIIPVEEKKQYNITVNGINNLESILYTTSPTTSWSSMVAIRNFPFAVNTKENDKYIILAFEKTNITREDIDNLKFMVQSTNITDNTYEPYHVPVTDYTHEAVADGIGWGNKNLITGTFVSDVKNGITFTANNDGTVTANGTASADSYISCSEFLVKKGNYIVNGVVGSSASTYYFDFSKWPDGTVLAKITDGDVGVTLSEDTVVKIWLNVKSGQVLSNVVFKPMLRKADIADPTYEPYHSSVKQTLRDAEVIEGKNLLHIPESVVTQEINGVTFTVNRNTDGEVISVKVNGTASAQTTFTLFHENTNCPFIGDIISGCPSGGSGSTYDLRITDDTQSTTAEYGEGATVSVSKTGSYTVAIMVRNGQSVSNLMFYPMIRYATETDATYEPYYTPLKESKFDRAEQRVLGAKNLIQNTNGTETVTGVTFTVNADDSVSVSGTPDSGTNPRYEITHMSLPIGTYIISGDDKSISPISYGFIGLLKNNTGSYICGTEGSGVTDILEVTNTTDVYYFYIRMANGKTYSNTFKPMLRLASDPDNTYAPYAMTNKQLTDAVNDIEKIENNTLLRDTVGWTGKNLIPFPYVTDTKTENGVTFTNNGDGSVTVSTVSGGATANATMVIANKDNADYSSLLNKSCILSGGKSTNLSLRLWSTSNISIDEGSGDEFVMPSSLVDNWNIYICVLSGAVITTPVTVYPMLRHADISDSTYEPYHETVKQTLRDAEVIEGKNLLHIPESVVTQEINDVVFTVNRNASGEVTSIVANGTASANATLYLMRYSNLSKYNGCIMTGCPASGGDSSYFMLIQQNGSPYTEYARDNGSGVTVTNVPDSDTTQLFIRIVSGYTANNLTFYPMLRYVTETDATYEPYYIPLKESKFDRAEQAVLGAKNLLDKTNVYTKSNALTLTQIDTGINAVVSTSAPHCNVQYLYENVLKHNTAYIISTYAEITSGKCLIQINGKVNSGDTETTIVASQWITSSGDLSVTFDVGNYNEIKIYLFVTDNVVTTASVNYNNLMLRLASDPDNTYAPYAMTNKQLTDSLHDGGLYLGIPGNVSNLLFSANQNTPSWLYSTTGFTTKDNLHTKSIDFSYKRGSGALTMTQTIPFEQYVFLTDQQLGTTDTTITFSNWAITTSSAVDVWCSDSTVRYKSIDIPSNGTCNVIFPAQTTAKTVNLRLYVK